ncbi:hypothetical protein ACE1OE_19430 [Vibrio sp. E150_011]
MRNPNVLLLLCFVSYFAFSVESSFVQQQEFLDRVKHAEIPEISEEMAQSMRDCQTTYDKQKVDGDIILCVYRQQKTFIQSEAMVLGVDVSDKFYDDYVAALANETNTMILKEK